MSVSVKCEGCGQRYNVPSSLDARTIKCRRCGGHIEVPIDFRLPPPPGGAPAKPTASVTGESAVIKLSAGDSAILNDAAARAGATPVAKPVAKPTAAKPVAANPATANPAAVNSAAANSAAANPAVAKPAADKPVSGKPPAAAPVVSIPVAQPAAMAAPVARAEPISPAAHALVEKLEAVEAHSMAELLAEQELEEQKWFRGFRRWLSNPTNPHELANWAKSHKLLLADMVVGTFLVAEFLRNGDLMLALLFLLAGIALAFFAAKPFAYEHPLYLAGGWCYLVVLCLFPFLMRYQESLAQAMIESKPPGAATVASTPAAPPRRAAPAAPAPSTAPAAAAAADVDDVAANVPATFADEPVRDVAPTIVPEPLNPLPSVPADVPTAPLAEAGTKPVERAAAAPLKRGSEMQIRAQLDKLFADGRAAQAMQTLYALAIVNPDSDLWDNFRYCPLLERPVLAVRWGVAMELDELASVQLGLRIGSHATDLTKTDAQTNLGNALVLQTRLMNGPLAVTWLRNCYDQGLFGEPDLIRPPATRELRGATYLGVDTPKELLRIAQREQLDLLLVFSARGVPVGKKDAAGSVWVHVVNVLTGDDCQVVSSKSEIVAAKTKPRPQQQLVGKDVEGLLPLLETKMKPVKVAEIPALNFTALEERFKRPSMKRGEALAAGLAEIVYYEKHKLISPDQLARLAGKLLGDADGKAFADASPNDRRPFLQNCLP